MKGIKLWLTALAKPSGAALRAALTAAAAGLPAAAVLAAALVALLPPDAALLFASFCKGVLAQLPLPR